MSKTADRANTRALRRPLIEDADDTGTRALREQEPGDFLVIQLPLQGVRYEAAKCYKLVGLTVNGAQGAFTGEILCVYMRIGFFGGGK